MSKRWRDLLDPEFKGIYEAGYLDAGMLDDLRVWGEVAASARAGDKVDPQLEIRSSQGAADDKPMWSESPGTSMWADPTLPMWQSWGPWKPWTVGELRAQLVQHRLVYQLSDGAPTIRNFRPVVDVPPRAESGQGVYVPAEGVSISFAKPFHLTPTMQATVTGGAIVPEIPDELVTTEGFFVQLYALDGTPVAGKINWTASTE